MTANYYIVQDDTTGAVRRWGTCPAGQEAAQAGTGEVSRTGTPEEIAAIMAGTFEE